MRTASSRLDHGVGFVPLSLRLTRLKGTKLEDTAVL